LWTTTAGGWRCLLGSGDRRRWWTGAADNAKLIRDSASDYKRLFALVKTKLAKERGFTL
jgi:hypothetical protein